MENKTEDTQTESTSRPSSRGEKRASSPSPSTTSSIASILVSETLDRTFANISELMQCITQWEDEERSKADDDGDESSAASLTQQKIERHLHKFFNLRQVFAEHRGKTPEVSEEDLVPEMEPTPEPSEQAGHRESATISTQTSSASVKTQKSAGRLYSKIYNKMKSAWKKRFSRKSKKKSTAVENLDKTDESCTVLEEASSAVPICSSDDVKDATNAELRSTSLELVGSSAREEDHDANMDLPPISTGQFNLGAEQNEVDEIIETANSILTSPKELSPVAAIGSTEDTEAEKADLSSVPLETTNVDVLSVKKDVAPEPSTTVTSPAQPLSPVPLEAVDEDVLSKPSTTSSSTPGPSEQEGHHECATVSTQISSASDKKTSSRRLYSKIYKTMKSAWRKRSSRKSKEKDQPTAEENLDEADESESRELSCNSTSLEEAYSAVSIFSSDDVKDATKAELRSTSLELVDNVEHEDIILHGENVVSSQPAEHFEVGSSAREEDHDANMDLPPIPTGRFNLGAEQNVDEIIKTANNILTSSSSSPKELSPVAAVGSIEDKEAEKADLSSVPLETANVDVLSVQKDVAPEPSTTVTSPAHPLSPVPPEAVDEDVLSEQAKDVAPEPSTTSSSPAHPLSPVPLELVGENIPSEEEDVAPEPSTTSSPPAEHHGEGSSVTDQDRVIDRDSAPPGQDPETYLGGSLNENGEETQLTGLKNIFYTIIKGFFNNLTEKEQMDLSGGVYYMDVKEKLIDLGVEVLRVIIKAIIDILSKAIYQSPTSSLASKTEAADQKLPSTLFRESFGITEEKIQKILDGSFGEAFCDVVGADTYVSMTPKLTKAIVKSINDEVNSVLTETIQESVDRESSSVCATCCKFSCCKACRKMLAGVIQALNSTFKAAGTSTSRLKSHLQIDCESKGKISTDAQPIKVKKKKSKVWRLFGRLQKNKVEPISDEQIHKALTINKSSSGRSLSRKGPSQLNTQLVDYVEVEGATSEKTGNFPSSYSTSYYPTACRENILPDYQKSSFRSKGQTKVRSSSCHQCDDSDNGKNVLLQGLLQDKEIAKRDSYQDPAVWTKRPSPLKGEENTPIKKKKKSKRYSYFGKKETKIQPVSVHEQVDEAMTATQSSSGHLSPPQATSSKFKLLDYVEDEDATSEDNGKITSPYSSACLKNMVKSPDCQKTASLSESQTEVKSFSFHQSDDPDNKKFSDQLPAVQPKKPSLLKKMMLFFRRLSFQDN